MDYSYIIIPIIATFSSQALKLVTDGVKGNFDLKNMLGAYGGFPSSHTAFAVSLTTLIGLRLGFDQPLFGAALVFTLIVMRDAATFRRVLGQQSKLLNQMITAMPNFKNFPKFQERLGHSGFEVLGGAVYGVAITYLLNLVLAS